MRQTWWVTSAAKDKHPCAGKKEHETRGGVHTHRECTSWETIAQWRGEQQVQQRTRSPAHKSRRRSQNNKQTAVQGMRYCRQTQVEPRNPKKKKNTGKNVWKTQHNKLPSDVGCVQDSQEWPEIYPKWALERIWSANRLHLQRSYISRGWEHWEPQRNRTPNVRPGSAANEVGPSPQAGRNELYNNDCDGGYKVDLRESAQWEKSQEIY